MKFHTRRPIALAAIILTASAALTACGSDGGDTEAVPGQGKTADRLDAVSISGTIAASPRTVA